MQVDCLKKREHFPKNFFMKMGCQEGNRQVSDPGGDYPDPNDQNCGKTNNFGLLLLYNYYFNIEWSIQKVRIWS